MSNPSKQWGGVRRHSGRPFGGAREAHRILKKSLTSGKIDDCADIVTQMILEGRGGDILKIWYNSLSVYAAYKEVKEQTEKKQASLVDAYTRPTIRDLEFDFELE